MRQAAGGAKRDRDVSVLYLKISPASPSSGVELVRVSKRRTRPHITHLETLLFFEACLSSTFSG